MSVNTKRDYGQFCGLAASLTVIGERWTMLIVRELLISPRRFSELTENLPGIGPNLLSERLRTLIQHGVIEQQTVRGDGRGKVYLLSPVGEQLRAPILALAQWGLQFLTEDDAAGFSRAEWGFLAVQSMVDDDEIPGLDEEYEFRVDDQVFTIAVHNGEVRFRRGPAEVASITVHTDSEVFIKIGARMLTPFDAIITGDLKIDGEQEPIRRCTKMLQLST